MNTGPMKFYSFAEFYPYYLKEHSNGICRFLHYMGSTLTLAMLVFAVTTMNFWWLLTLPLIGYSFAWFGHFVFERNKPATFQYPLYSLMGDWVMYKDALVYMFTRKRSAAAKQAWS
ncbi:Mpo1-like protein [Aliidiomarina quisquiliarum]|uniref:Mpo1-like protein n=1 Tax=Aliidiomarina quisquiliarum TaxID=2938947 RepID=UPI00208EBD34|nr:Mpo1-like protein [Aliidiomarina quisquiliarum]MCO4320435.1 DUF962 domain-containing protein [Aliidiomarina quisquiliarum]